MGAIDFYKVLGVAPDASRPEIERAYRALIFKLHPDTSPEAGRASAIPQFHDVQEAWSVLRDARKREQYDRMRQAGFAGSDFESAAGGVYGTPWGQPSMGGDNWEEAFDVWWRKHQEEFADYEEERAAKERMSAERMAKAAAWEWEKQEARQNKVRAERLKYRTEDARMQRHATTLRRFWQTHSGFTRGDALVAALFLAGTAGIAFAWKSHVREARLHHYEQQQGQGQGQGQQQGQAAGCHVRQPAQLLPAAAVAAAAQPP